MKSVPLNDTSNFELISGLWKEARGPLKSTRVLRSTNFAGDGMLDFDDVVELEVENRHFASRQLQPGTSSSNALVAAQSSPSVGPHSSSPSTITCTSPATSQQRFVSKINRYSTLATSPSICTRSTLMELLKPSNAQQRVFAIWTGVSTSESKCQHILCRNNSPSRALSLVRTAYRNEQHLSQTFMALKRSALSSIFTHGLRGEAQKDTEIGPMPIDWTVERLDACARVVSTRMSYTELEVAENTTETPENAVRVIGIKVSDMNHAGNETVLVRTALEKALDATQATHQCAPPAR